ncbi:head GIN domain-containing protein [Flagellimonas flava]|uniref:Putative auto-transporter adhesin, head GIN domain n=1 Tax=Flagellimonas flava TaxID=570519 RepID=A0A1M5I117_9FLAO|nr:head GIN domain-containing protein [Allomuricauda flava]SHG21730.1 Putative auto-transporter adhesin, head GIN domain [Allomuricauda flava]
MTTLAKIAIAFLLAIFASSCKMDISFGDGKRGNGEVVEETRKVTDEFTVVSASEGLDVFVTQDQDFKISVEADENVIDLIGTDIKDGKLRIHAIENIGRATKKIYVSLPVITALKSSSGADLIAQNIIEAKKIELDASSGSDLHIELRAIEVSADASSGADIKISGSTDALYADASSGADIRARELIAKTCNADASSGSDISVNVTDSLVADASSGADISYTGEASVQTKKSVSGSVHKY